MDELIAKLEAATSGSAELDLAVHAVVGGVYYLKCTRSLDDAVALVPEGWSWNVGQDYACLALPGNGFLSDRGDIELYGAGKTPAISLTIAALRARSVSHKEEQP